ncbi:hypothetical protein BC830DRAFT_1152799 [Chytriomyces sp. MP71]|nr:hypothetical protein BC830DRAFT_1152799 [Chytriomyces sp. MP71]
MSATINTTSQARNIMVAIDESTHSVGALKFVLTNLITSPEDVITAAVVIQSETDKDMVFSRTKTLISAVYDSYPSLPCKFAIQIAAASSSQVGAKLCELAEKAHPDMLVLGSAGKSHLEGMVMGSVSNYAIAHANCPVVVARLTSADEARLARFAGKGMAKGTPLWA